MRVGPTSYFIMVITVAIVAKHFVFGPGPRLPVRVGEWVDARQGHAVLFHKIELNIP